jgi:hypothetical protein
MISVPSSSLSGEYDIYKRYLTNIPTDNSHMASDGVNYYTTKDD